MGLLQVVNVRSHTETEGNAAARTFEGGVGAVLAAKTPLGRLGRVTDIASLVVKRGNSGAWNILKVNAGFKCPRLQVLLSLTKHLLRNC